MACGTCFRDGLRDEQIEKYIQNGDCECRVCHLSKNIHDLCLSDLKELKERLDRVIAEHKPVITYEIQVMNTSNINWWDVAAVVKSTTPERAEEVARNYSSRTREAVYRIVQNSMVLGLFHRGGKWK